MRGRSRLLVAAFAAALVPALLGGCGGDDDSADITQIGVTGGTTPTALPQDEFIDQADAICGETDAAIESVGGTDAADDPAASADQEADLLQGLSDQLQTLVPPDEDQRTLDRFLEALDDLAAARGRESLALERDDPDALAEIQAEIAEAESDLSAAAEAYGFRDCGDPAEPVPGGDSGDGEVAPTTPIPEPAPVPAPAPEPAPPPEPPTGGTGEAPPPDDGGTGGVTPGSGGVSP